MKHINNYTTIYSPIEIQLAHEIGERLNDPAALIQWLEYTQLLPHDFLRKELNKVCSMPDYKITSSRAGLFVHIVKNQIAKIERTNDGYSRN